ncbi:hybrid sensor histidine kinase/response regulator [Bradyrhizobium sp. 35]|uniref:sensor histidine kinase n=1 Tax=Bradyrhizobium sp. 35 TaxID=2782670 RepID=UPI001FF7D55A|nr:hybrid sensor histidine kinase/response regulator [Bradyrhizobium sp. 35]MCK1453556.1 hybrid sensor histidine kinase/response regulator [Bradyrhizobium sp. 35]
MVVFPLSAILPSALWLTTSGPPFGIEHTAAICLLALLPCMAATGSIGLSKSKIAINNRLDIAELLEIKARQAQQIEELFAERTRFFSAASHDLRQPLNAMGMYFELLSRSPYHGDRGEILDRLRDCAGSLMRQFDAIMEVAAADADIRNVNERETAVQEIFERVSATLEPRRKEKVFNCARSILASIASLIQCCSNACCSTSPATPSNTRKKAGFCWGLAPEVPASKYGSSIQELESKLSTSTRYSMTSIRLITLSGTGTKDWGIGLAVVRRLCSAMQWEIDLRSLPRRGTTFTLSVPKVDAVVMAPEGPTLVGQTTSAQEMPGIVVIDDDPGTRDSLRRLLSQSAYECFTFDAGEPAVNFLRNEGQQKPWHILSNAIRNCPLCVMKNCPHHLGYDLG